MGASLKRWLCHPAVLVALLGALTRGIYLLDSLDYPAFWVPIIDADHYDGLARQLASGENPGAELYWQPAFFPAYLSLVYRAFAGSILAAKLLGLLLGVTTCVLVWRLGSLCFGPRIGALSGCLFACYGPALFFETELLATGWATFWGAALPLLFMRTSSSRTPVTACVTGAGLALSILTRPSFLPFALLGSIFFWRQLLRANPRPSHGSAKAAALLAGFLLIAGPALWHRAQATGRASLLPLSGGVNLYVGNNNRRCETLAARPGRAWQAIVDQAEKAGAGRDPAAHNDYFYAQVFAYARAQPFDFARGLFEKSKQLIAARELPRNVDVYTAAEWSPSLSLLTFGWRFFAFPWGILLPLAALGLLIEPRRVPAALWLFLLSYALAIVAVFVSARYRMPLVPVLSICAARGLSLLLRAPKGARMGRVGLLLAVALISNLPRDPCGQTRRDAAELYLAVAERQLGLGQTGAALRSVDNALRLRPTLSEAHLTAAMAHVSAGHDEAALRELSAYLEDSPGDTLALRQKASLLELSSDYAGAIKAYRAALAREPTHLEMTHRLAWLLVAAPDPAVWEPRAGLKLARKAARLSHRSDPRVLNTLAYALAKVGLDREASRVEKEAQGLAKKRLPRDHD